MTGKYKTWCQHDYHQKWRGCWVAYPYPMDEQGHTLVGPKEHNEQGRFYNCFINCIVDEYQKSAAVMLGKIWMESWTQPASNEAPCDGAHSLCCELLFMYLVLLLQVVLLGLNLHSNMTDVVAIVAHCCY